MAEENKVNAAAGTEKEGLMKTYPTFTQRKHSLTDLSWLQLVLKMTVQVQRSSLDFKVIFLHATWEELCCNRGNFRR